MWSCFERCARMVDIGELVKRRGRETIRPANQASSNQPLKKSVVKSSHFNWATCWKKNEQKRITCIRLGLSSELKTSLAFSSLSTGLCSLHSAHFFILHTFKSSPLKRPSFLAFLALLNFTELHLQEMRGPLVHVYSFLIFSCISCFRGPHFFAFPSFLKAFVFGFRHNF